MDYKKKIFWILIFSLLIRLIGINQSLWLDEAISVNQAKLPINAIVSQFSYQDFHPPVYYWFLNIWIKIFGDQVWMMRLSSILFSLITVWLVYLIGNKIKNKNVGLWAAALVGVNPLLIYFSQELRMYSMATMWLIGSVYFLIKILDPSLKLNKNWKNIFWFNLMTALSFVTFYGSVFLIGAEILYLIFHKKFKLAILSSLGLIVAILGVGPLLLSQFIYSRGMLTKVVNWNLVLGNVNLKNLFLIPLKFSIGKISWWPKMSYYLIGGIWSLMVIGTTIKGLLKNKLLKFLLIVPIILGIIFSLKSPLLQYFRFLYLIPIFCLLISIGCKEKTKLFLMTGFLIFSGIYLINPKMHRENWKNLTNSLSNNDNIYMIQSFADPIIFYNSNLKINDIKTKSPTEDVITVVPYGEEIHEVSHTNILEGLGYIKNDEKDFMGVTKESWIKGK